MFRCQTSYLQTDGYFCQGKSIGMLPCAVEDTGNGEGAEEDEKYLSSSISHEWNGAREEKKPTHAMTANQSSRPKLFTKKARQ